MIKMKNNYLEKIVILKMKLLNENYLSKDIFN